MCQRYLFHFSCCRSLIAFWCWLLQPTPSGQTTTMLDHILQVTFALLLPTPPMTIPPRFNPTLLRNITSRNLEIPSCIAKFSFLFRFPLILRPSSYPLRPTLRKPIQSPTFNRESFGLRGFFIRVGVDKISHENVSPCC